MAYVREDHRRTGVAAGLLQCVTAFAKDRGILQLELCVSAANMPAIAFYRRQRFSDLCIIPAGIIEEGKWIDEVQMVRTIARPA